MEDTENEYIPPNHDYGSMEIKPKLLTDESIKNLLLDYSEQFAKHIGDDVESFVDWFLEVSEEYKTLRLKHEEEVKKLISFLQDHEQWEADFISENKLWWPNRASDVLTGEIYDKWMQLQAKRNQLLNLYRSADRNKV